VVEYARQNDTDTREDLMKTIKEENQRLQNYRRDLRKIINNTTKLLDKQNASSPFQKLVKITQQKLSSLSKIYQRKKEEVMLRGEEWRKQIDETVTSLHKELDEMQKEHESLLQKQKAELEDIVGKIDEINTKATELNESQNLKEMKELISRIENEETPTELSQYSFPVFCAAKVDENYLKSYFGFIENIQERRIPLVRLTSEDAVVENLKILEVPRVITAIDTGFSAREENNNCLYDIVTMGDNRVWMGGARYELKLFDFQGVLHDTVPITVEGMYLTVHNKHVVYTDCANTVYRVADDKTIQTIFTTGEWLPCGITSTVSGDLLICLHKNEVNQYKVVRYSSTGTVLQEIQYDSQGRLLYKRPHYIAENVNGDIIVTDWKKKAVIAVDRLGIFRFSYSGRDDKFKDSAVTTDPAGHVIVTEINGHKIHMLDRDGRFLRYIIPDQGIKSPRGVCIVGGGEMFVGEQNTGVAKRIKYLDS
jgi:uncharacterized protein YoxC